jgi:hypothetical protein
VYSALAFAKAWLVRPLKNFSLINENGKSFDLFQKKINRRTCIQRSFFFYLGVHCIGFKYASHSADYG